MGHTKGKDEQRHRRIAEQIVRDDRTHALRDELDLALADVITSALSAQASVVAWQGIESAPEDGTRILVSGGDLTRVQTAEWNPRVGCWDCEEGCLEGPARHPDEMSGPTHWMPLPDPPAESL